MLIYGLMLISLGALAFVEIQAALARALDEQRAELGAIESERAPAIVLLAQPGYRHDEEMRALRLATTLARQMLDAEEQRWTR